jgi:hypothetical protein
MRAAMRHFRFTMRYLLCGRINALPDGPMIASGVDTMARAAVAFLARVCEFKYLVAWSG